MQYCPFCWVVECWIMNCLIFNARLLNTNNNPHFCKRFNNLQCDVFDDWKWIVKLIFFFNVKTNYVLARPFGNMPRYLIGWLADHIAVIIHISLCCPCLPILAMLLSFKSLFKKDLLTQMHHVLLITRIGKLDILVENLICSIRYGSLLPWWWNMRSCN